MNRGHILSGIRWTLATSVLRRAITLALFYFVALWLSKEELGAFREYCLILSLFSGLSLLSLDFHLIIERRGGQTALLALWQMALLASGAGIVLLSLAAGLLGLLYRSELLGRMLLYTSVFLALEILRRTVRSAASRQLQFRPLALAETWNVIVYAALSLPVLYFVRSVWVYLIAFFIGNAVELAWLWRINQRQHLKAIRSALRRRLVLRSVLHKYRGFVTQATMVTLLNQVAGNAPILVLGMLVEPVWMGLYFFASQLVGVPVSLFTGALNQVFFPVLAGRRDGDIAGLAGRYLRLAGWVGLPLAAVYTWAVAWGVGMLFGGKWDDALPLLPAMLILFGTSLYVNPLGGIPFLKRKPGWELGWNAASLLARSMALLLGLRHSFTAAVTAYAIASAVTNLAFFIICLRLVGMKIMAVLPKALLSLVPAVPYALLPLGLTGMSMGRGMAVCLLGWAALFWLSDVFCGGRLRSDLRLLALPDRGGPQLSR